MKPLRHSRVATRPWSGPLTIAAALCAMAAMTWMAWPDPVVDFGRELYVPWRIVEGDALYRDVAYFNGPLSPHVNALLFAVFGVSLRTLVFANLAILAGVTALVYRMAGTLASLALVGIFAFGQYAAIGNFNWVTPYSHEMTHGAAIGALLVYACSRRTVRGFAVAGCAAGLALLTKVEIAVAVVGALGVTLLMLRDRRMTLAVLPGLVLPPVIAYALCGPGALGSFALMLDSTHHVGDPFLAAGMGMDDPLGNLTITVVAGVATLIVWRYARLFAIPAIVWAAFGFPYVQYVGRGLPLVMIVLAVLLLRNRKSSVLAIASVSFSLLMLLKIFFATRLYHYGFALASPAALVLIALPRKHHAAWACIVLCVIAGHVRITYQRAQAKTEWLATGADAFRITPNDATVAATLRFLDEHARDGDTLAVMPQGVMLNYLTRRPASTPYINFIPHEVNLYGEQAIIAAFEKNPPTWIVFMHADTSEYGPRYFARDYAKDLAAWVVSHYNAAQLIGPVPFRDDLGGVMIFRRRAEPRVE